MTICRIGFFVQSASYGYYYIDVEINRYDVYRISIYSFQGEPNSGMLGYPVEKTTTRSRTYARRRYNQFIQYAEEDMYGWNTDVDDLTWEFDESDWDSITRYIL